MKTDLTNMTKCFYLGLAASLMPALTPALVTAQSIQSAVQSESVRRAQPAPWRPAFSPINQSDSGQSAPPPANVRPLVETNPVQNAPAINLKTSAVEFDQTTVQTVGGNLPLSDATDGITRVTQRLDSLPNSAGQIWREYDITPYTSKITTSDQPEQAILDWILKETGTEMWFRQPLGILHANKNQLYVYHTPEIHRVIKGIVDRFVRTQGQMQRIEVNLITVENPNWRARAYTMLQPIEVRDASVEAWMISKENAAILQSQLSRRLDYRQLNSGSLTNHDGQTFSLEKMRPTQFVRNLRWVPNQTPNYQPQLSTINEGYSLAISCLSSLDNRTIEASIKCNIDQIEKLSNVRIKLPRVAGNAQEMNLQIPQLVSWRIHERFRWPNDQVLLLSCGVVANPDPEQGRRVRIPGLTKNVRRADALLFLDYRGPATGSTVPRTVNSSTGLAPIGR